MVADVVLLTLTLKPILMRTEIGGTQASLISPLSEAPPLAYFVHNAYLDPSVFGNMWFKCKRVQRAAPMKGLAT